MTQTYLKIALITLCLNVAVGCGKKGTSLATEHGNMSIEEYEKLVDQSQAEGGDDSAKEE
ncbi:hypothetical protein [Rhodopirellula sallentina]|uniref:Uncharacterized protein n=1 Tax=Rhodopirellula sallentina SM41 TaxID=1263870 RepID=M5TW64_9BACT|nr:hypothetical protein [Rhodopirellula sallentina]EMI53415.1 hypothetical protein RSSM_05162 [Rhodopirellula sallentina SM41]